MIADSATRRTALDTSASFIVQAPAGSGKTELLIQRYLKLLQAVDSPDAVIAITFTRKAAAEMRARVIEALRKAQQDNLPEAEHERVTFEIARAVLQQDARLGWGLLENPARMNIETIDALCGMITRRMPWLARFGAMPEVSEIAKDLYREAARNTLSHADEENDALAYLLLHLDNDFMSAERLIIQMLEKRDQWLRHTGVDPDFEAVREALEQSFRRVIVEELTALRAKFADDIAQEIAILRDLQAFPEARIDDLGQWKAVADLLLTNDGKLRRVVNRTTGFPPEHPLKPRAERLLARVQNDQELLQALQRFRVLPAPEFSDSQWQAMQAAVSVLTLAVAELQMVFRERARVDFSELSLRASEALGRVESPTDLALALGQRIQHILVDEFQDTSFTHFELLEKLTAGWEPGDGHTLFLVGDPMQSIYRFRQADVGLFLKARRDGIGSVRLEPLTLTMNFRSRPELVAWANGTFETIFPRQDDLESGAVAFSRSASLEGKADSGSPAVTASGFLDNRDEAERVIEFVRSASSGTCAILVRARSHLTEIAAALRRNRIRFQAIEIDELGERAVIEDLMALTFALLHAADRVSWLALLRAPWCGLSLSDLHALAGADQHATIWELLHDHTLSLSADGAARVRRILPVFERAIADRGRRPLRAWIEETWMRLGGPACLADETALEDAAAYFDLLDTQADGADLADFGWFREQVNTLFAQPDAGADERLQVMTIHKAKGLEFDTVILPGLSLPARSEEQQLFLWLEQQGELLLAAMPEAGQDDPIYEYLRHIESSKIEQETCRLLYVAATRARKALHLTATLATKDDGSIADPQKGSLLRLLWPTLASSFAPAARSAQAEPHKINAIRRLPIDWRIPPPPPPVSWTPAQGQIASAGVTFEWAGPSARFAGIAVHDLLHRIGREGVEKWNAKSVSARRAVYESALRNLGVSPAELAETSERVEKALIRTLNDSKGLWILSRHTDGEFELAITGRFAGEMDSIAIDRTFVDDAGVRWIIDYKTGWHAGGNPEKFLDDEMNRYRGQLERYARFMIRLDQRPVRLGLYFPLLSGWREWAVPMAMPQQASLFEL